MIFFNHLSIFRVNISNAITIFRNYPQDDENLFISEFKKYIYLKNKGKKGENCLNG